MQHDFGELIVIYTCKWLVLMVHFCGVGVIILSVHNKNKMKFNNLNSILMTLAFEFSIKEKICANMLLSSFFQIDWLYRIQLFVPSALGVYHTETWHQTRYNSEEFYSWCMQHCVMWQGIVYILSLNIVKHGQRSFTITLKAWLMYYVYTGSILLSQQ